jgi:hypothetical protein
VIESIDPDIDAQPSDEDTVPDPGEGLEVVGEPTRSLVTSESALSLSEARLISGRRGATVVLLMGEVSAGKTTLLAELWTRFLLDGEIGGLSLAGSRTAIALEERAYLSRMRSMAVGSDTARTSIDNEGFLHMRVARNNGKRVELLLSDVSGEHFERIREGTRLVDELPWVSRVDRFAVFVDGQGLAQPGLREIIINRVTRALYALRDSGSVVATARAALVLVKDDLLGPAARGRFEARLPALLNTIREVDPQAPLLSLAARPAGGEAPYGLDAFLKWVVEPDRRACVSYPLPIPSRSIGRFQA